MRWMNGMRTARIVLCAALPSFVGLTANAVSLATPAPLVTGDGASTEAIGRLDKGEFSLALEVQFDSLPSKGSPMDLVRLFAEADGTLVVTVPAKASALEGDFVAKTRTKVKAGEWHHVAFTYSLIRRRVTLYLDGHLEYENDDIYPPETGLGGCAKGFAGKARDLKVWDIAFESERILPSGASGKSLWDVRSERNEAALKARLEKEFAANPQAVKTDGLVAYTTDPMSQVRLLPYMIPTAADFSGALRVVAAQDEFEAGSLVVMARRPVKNFTVRMGDLVSETGAKIDAKDVDIRLVKRWYRSGGAWFSYFCDYRQRVLTPHLLVYDDALIKVDEIRARNYFRLDYPEGTRYTDVSDPQKGQQGWNSDIPFNDAKTLQPIANLTEFGRNQQYWILFHATKDTKPGTYRGALDLVEDGRTVAKMPVSFRVLDFALPVYGASYDDLSRTYMSHLNIQGQISQGRTYREMYDSALAELKSIRNHNSLDCSSVFKDDLHADLARKAGFSDKRLWSCISRSDVPRWQEFFPDKKAEELTAADRALGMRVAERFGQAVLDYYDTKFPDAEKWSLFFSEATSYGTLNVMHQDQVRIAHKHGIKVFAHGMGNYNYDFAGDLQDGQILTSTDRVQADRWHAIGAPVGDYAKPFASPENPAVHRRQLGFGRYKGSHMDGHMQHGMMNRDPNQFAPNPGGDGNYRCQIMIHPTQAGFLETICWEAVREAYDDVRYLTLLKQLATPHLSDGNEPLRREARRALVWLENRDGDTASMDMVRLGAIERILVLKDLIAKKGGK